MILFKHFINSYSNHIHIIYSNIYKLAIFQFITQFSLIFIIWFQIKKSIQMQVRAFKLPPLPGKKSPPLQIMKRINRIFEDEQPHAKTPSYAKQIKQIEKSDSKQNVRVGSSKRPSSVRQLSRQSINSRASHESRNSSREKSIQLLKEKINHNVKARVSMPSVTAKSWGVYQMKQAKLLYGKRVFKSRQIASLTKMMNLITIIEMMEQFKLAPAKIKFKVSRQASYMIGTTAQIKQNYQLSLYDLYFGMMLPSGNDAAHQIAQIGGSLLMMSKNEGEIKKQIAYNMQAFTQYYRKQNCAVHAYLAQMNRISKRLQMSNSHFANPHGLSNPDNYSCVEDLSRLCTFCMENQIFRFVVKAQQYTADYVFHTHYIMQPNGMGDQPGQPIKIPQKINSSLRWENTNKMLKQGWSGLKTGITPNAGPCLSASVQKFLNGRNLQFLVILIDSASMEARWKQVKQIVEWVISQKIYF